MNKELRELQKQFMPEDTKAGLIQSFLDDFSGTQVCSKLIYAEALNRKVIYHLKNGEQVKSTERFSSVCDTLMQYPEFILPHRSLLVNMNYIRSITTADMRLINGRTIPLAQRRVSEIKKQYLAFQMEEFF